MNPLNEYLPPDDRLAIAIRDASFPGAEILSIPITQFGQVGQCYANVRARVEKDGGSETYGWLLTVWPGRFVKALHHSVWRAPDGALEDVSTHPFPLVTGTRSTFIVDQATPIRSDGLDPAVPSKFLQLDRKTETRDYIHATQNRTRAIGEILEILTSDDVELQRDGPSVFVVSCPEALESALHDARARLDRFSDRKDDACMKLLPKSHRVSMPSSELQPRPAKKQGANTLCFCGSQKKYKRCHGK